MKGLVGLMSSDARRAYALFRIIDAVTKIPPQGRDLRGA
jgi:hypothetical protein